MMRLNDTMAAAGFAFARLAAALRPVGLALAILGLAAPWSVSPASAQELVCPGSGGQKMKASGPPKARLKAAEREARNAWNALARSRLGAGTLARFDQAPNRALNCGRSRGRHSCTATASLCKRRIENTRCPDGGEAFSAPRFKGYLEVKSGRDGCFYRAIRPGISVSPPYGPEGAPPECPTGYKLQARPGRDVCVHGGRF